ncbi:MAG: AMP-binding protein, partial [Vulcanimicrobiaceae bacterium]
MDTAPGLHTERIESLLSEARRFPPSMEFASRANAIGSIYDEADRDYESFWAGWARQLDWARPFTEVLEWQEPFARWFWDGQLNASVNALDRHVGANRGDRIAYYFEGESGDRRAITYRQLLDDVCRFANGLRKIGVKRGDRVAIYLPMIPELPIAMLACARIG